MVYDEDDTGEYGIRRTVRKGRLTGEVEGEGEDEDENG